MGTVLRGNSWPPAKGPSAAYLHGVADGQRARAEGTPLTVYLQVGMDEYAKGYRGGFFGHERIEDLKGTKRP